MKEQLLIRLEQLKQEFAKGQERLNLLEKEAQETRNAMLRISGAIQVLEEEVGKEDTKGMSEPANANNHPDLHQP